MSAAAPDTNRSTAAAYAPKTRRSVAGCCTKSLVEKDAAFERAPIEDLSKGRKGQTGIHRPVPWHGSGVYSRPRFLKDSSIFLSTCLRIWSMLKLAGR